MKKKIAEMNLEELKGINKEVFTDRTYIELEEHALVTEWNTCSYDLFRRNYMIDVKFIDDDNITIYLDRKVFKN